MERLQTTLAPAIGRVLMSIIFIMAGFGKVMSMDATVGYIASVGLPAPSIGYYVAVIVELGGGLLLLAGFATRYVAAVLALFCLFTAFVFHGFGDMANQINAMKNFAMTGGFIYVLAFGAGQWSVDAMLSGRRGLTPQHA